MITETIELLGRKGKDKITGFEGVVISVTFDLFGCVQAALKPAIDKDGKTQDAGWFDVNRIEITDTNRVMDLPTWASAKNPAEYDKGPAEKPTR